MRGSKAIWICDNDTGQKYKIEIVPNQKIIQIFRIKNGINFEANNKAQETLSSDGYSLYMYLIKHAVGRIWALSSKNIYEHTKLAERTYNKAVKELIDNKYLIQHKIDLGNEYIYDNNSYYLLEDPSMEIIERSY